MKVKFSSLKWFSMELLIVSFFSFDNFENPLCGIFDVSVIIWSFCFLFGIAKNYIKIKKNLFTKHMAMYFLIVFASIFIANSRYTDNSVSMAMRVFPVIALSWSVSSAIDCNEEVIHIWRPIFIGGVIAVCYQLSHLNWDTLSLSIASNTLRVSLSDKIFVNTYALQALLSVIAGGYLLINTRNQLGTVFRRLIVYALILLIAIGMVLTGSRKVLVSLFIYLFVLICYGRKNFWKITIVFILVLASYQMLLQIPAFYNTVGWRIEMSVNDKNDASAKERKQLAEASLRTGKENLLGVGIDNSKYYNEIREVYAHNNYLEFFADFGLLGMALYYIFYIKMLMNILKYKKVVANIRNFYLATFVTLLFIEWYQVIYYNLGYFMTLAAISDYSTFLSRECLEEKTIYESSYNNSVQQP